ncbi:metallophosphoesterase [Methylobacterium durans]|uniref:Metallophosphoesterase n=1 Tax=Methylobacterium durans TaxID=2202825 RepID=A0A2U8W991_9HYPH|nr:metallophosphoesterase [Methylobacterium durans]AWN42579.1 metallophosphoesterase [Methylobacterium durans]
MPQPDKAYDDFVPWVFRHGRLDRRRVERSAAANARTPVAPDPPGGMRLWILSDLDVDRAGDAFRLPEALPAFDAMLVAGNVAEGLCGSVEWLASALGGRHEGRPVILVPGPREYRTGTSVSETLRTGRERGQELGITVLADETVRLGGPGDAVHLVGATLWSDWAIHGASRAGCARTQARHRWVEAEGIGADDGRPWGPHDAAGAHARSRAYIEDVLASIVVQRHGFRPTPASLVSGVGAGDRAVVLTHHAPSPRSLAPDWSGWLCDEWLAASQVSDLEAVLDAWGAPALWVHGRVPAAVDLRLRKTRVVANPRPAPGGRAFDAGLVVTV